MSDFPGNTHTPHSFDNDDFKVGDVVFERFEVLNCIGRGGMGLVYEVQDTNLQKRMALKVLNKETDKTTLVRFQNEARLLSRLSHPNIASVFDFGVSNESRAYIALELISGITLQSLVLKNQCLSIPQFS
ncbi:MAG: protein kinase, partial [Cyanobacteria bacterium]|nr:protein kinase [Cyanobacteriota bacterium]